MIDSGLFAQKTMGIKRRYSTEIQNGEIYRKTWEMCSATQFSPYGNCHILYSPCLLEVIQTTMYFSFFEKDLIVTSASSAGWSTECDVTHRQAHTTRTRVHAAMYCVIKLDYKKSTERHNGVAMFCGRNKAC